MGPEILNQARAPLKSTGAPDAPRRGHGRFRVRSCDAHEGPIQAGTMGLRPFFADPVPEMLRNIALGTFAALAAFWSYHFYDKSTSHERELEARDEQIVSLENRVAIADQTIDELEEKVLELELARELLRLNHRIAQIEIVRQGPAEDGSRDIETEFVFTELNDIGEPIGEGETMVIKGKQIYLDGVIVKFDDSYVESGDALRGTSVALFKRIFSEQVSANDGIVIDSKNKHPLPFQGDDLPDPLYQQLFERIWDYANSPEESEKLGVRAIHGEAVSIEAREGKTYRVELRQSDGLSLKAVK